MVAVVQSVTAKRWPKRQDLLSWFLWEKIWNSSLGEHERPEQVQGWLEEFNRTPLIETHTRMYETYHAFLEQFEDPLISKPY